MGNLSAGACLKACAGDIPYATEYENESRRGREKRKIKREKRPLLSSLFERRGEKKTCLHDTCMRDAHGRLFSFSSRSTCVFFSFLLLCEGGSMDHGGTRHTYIDYRTQNAFDLGRMNWVEDIYARERKRHVQIAYAEGTQTRGTLLQIEALEYG